MKRFLEPVALLVLALLVASSCTAGGTAAAAGTAAAGSPLLCAAMLSFNRPHYLIPSVRAFVAYMTAVEPDIPWMLQILDNGSGPEVLDTITTELAPLRHLDRIRLVHLEQGVGLSRGFNLLFFDMCGSTGAPYILSLEDDWQARSNWSATVPVMRASMQLLQHNERLLEVWLRDSFLSFRMHLNATWHEEQFTLAGSPDPRISSSTSRHQSPQNSAQQQQVTLHTLVMTCDPASHPWGGYTNGASLKAFDRLVKLGRMQHVDGEDDWSAKACWQGWHVAYICKYPSCFDSEKQWHWGLFEHIGRSRVPAALDARHKPAAAAPQASSAGETVQELSHHEVMSVHVRRRGYSIAIKAKWQLQNGLAGEALGGGGASRASWGGGILLLTVLLLALVFSMTRNVHLGMQQVIPRNVWLRVQRCCQVQ
ncbi:hypothetical protein COO60DRAFT_1541386 [Scenedesmus sp. NREL 46B-D3]|nr:hypothetical protein COO60DRAFT_1541386 [Scenedesmus sp. NREL 46B-D3]